ncbi:hypothetical protein Pmani_011146 [Petrolisthes manimaculis]|uniref:Uncharacterized protein n=1 Tax=Petrolisthes manimaculis TaxID=1843537 RepID=A0AAE1Q046_9EUCA|nr:hypothetical protein Pmani_011146 [Petrolisthes manimaculis]
MRVLIMKRSGEGTLVEDENVTEMIFMCTDSVSDVETGQSSSSINLQHPTNLSGSLGNTDYHSGRLLS